MKMTMEITVTINTSASTLSGTQKATMAFLGLDNESWLIIKALLFDPEDGWTINDSTYSATVTESIPITYADFSDMDGIEINQDGTKFRIPAGMMDEDSPELVFIKQ